MKKYLPAKGNTGGYLPSGRNARILYHAHDCRRAKQAEIFLALCFTPRHNWRYRVANTAEPQLSLPTSAKSWRSGSHFRLTLEAELSGIKNPPNSRRINARVCRAIVSSDASTSKVSNAFLNQMSFTVHPCISDSSGTTPSSSLQKLRMSRFKKVSQLDVQPLTGSPSTRNPNWNATSWSVIVHSPYGKWKVCVSGRHRSTSALINALS